MFCQNCGAFDTEDARFCSRCGESLSEVPRMERRSVLRKFKESVLGGQGGSPHCKSGPHRPSMGMLRALSTWLILSVALLALFVLVTGRGTTLRTGLASLLMIGTLAFLFMRICSRALLELQSLVSRAQRPETRVTGRPGLEDQSQDQIEWNIE